MQRPIFAAIASLLLISAAAQQPAPPPLLAQAVAATAAQKLPYAFDYSMQLTASVTGSTTTQAVNWRAHFDPRGQTPHLRLVDPPQLQGPSQQTFDAVARKLDGVNWCASTDMSRVRNAQLLREDAASAVFAFQPSQEMAGHGVPADKLRGEMTILKTDPDIADIHIVLAQPFPVLITTVTGLDMSIHCETAPNGRRYAADTVTQFSASALGHVITEHSITHTSNLAAVS